MTQPLIDLTRHHFMRELGDMVMFGTWVFSDDKEDTEPCLVLLPRYRSPHSVKPCVIALSAAFKYNDPKYMAGAAKHIAVILGFEDSMQRASKIANFILDNIEDLVRMPPNPTETVVGAEATIDFGNGVRKKLQLTEEVDIKQV